MKALYAGYASAGEGRKIALPYQPPLGVKNHRFVVETGRHERRLLNGKCGEGFVRVRRN